MANIFIKTFGCSLNCSDSEVMAGILEKGGFTIVKNIKSASLVIINSCTVKGPTEKKFFKYLETVKKKRKPLIVAGCIAQATPEKLEGYSLIGPSQINNICQVVEETLNGFEVTLLVQEKNPRHNLPKIRNNPIVEIIPISSGCLGDPCSYCIVKAARGHLVSYSKEAILKQQRKALFQGVREIWLTAQDTGCYGLDVDSSLPDLLKDVLKVAGNFYVRLGMLNPNHVLKYLDELIELYKSDKMFKFLHIPVQSGSDKILKKMKRHYKVADFVKIVEKFRSEIPDITIATDIICGFPGETNAQFTESIDLIKKIKPDVLNRSRFWPRPGTAAEKYKNQIPGSITKERSRHLSSVFSWICFENNKKWKSWHGYILIDEHGKDNTSIGRNHAYKQVIVEGKHQLGSKPFVRIVHTTKHDLRGRILKN